MPRVLSYTAVKPEKVTEGAAGLQVRWLITLKDGAEHFAMRLFEVEPGGYTPLHKHSWEHEVFVLEGEGEIFNGETTTPFRQGDAVFIHPWETHQFRNKSGGQLKFLCLIPNTGR
jgi:quercetin dioxygenase-like cupin family protein